MSHDPTVERRTVIKTLAGLAGLSTGAVTTGSAQSNSSDLTTDVAQSEWLGDGGGSRRKGVAERGPDTVSRRWLYQDFGDSEAVVTDDLILFNDTQNGRLGESLVAADPVTGNRVFSLFVRSIKTPAVGDGLLVTGDEALAAVDTEFGIVRWKRQDVTRPTASPAVVDGEVYTATLNPEELVSLSLDNGAERWRVPLDVTVRNIAVADGTVFATAGDDSSDPNGSVRAYAAADGSQQWTVGIGSASPLRPTVADGVVYTGTDEKLVALDAADGSTIWETNVGPLETEGVAVDSGTVYLGVNAGGTRGAPDEVVAVDAGSGSLLWTRQVNAVLNPSPVVADGTVYASGSDTLFVLDAADGSVLDTQSVVSNIGSGAIEELSVNQGGVYVHNGPMFAYEPDRPGVSATTVEVKDIGETTATFVGELDTLGSADAAEVFFDLGNRQTDRTTLTNPGTVEMTVGKLSSDFPRDVQFVAVGADGTTDIGDTIGFETQPPNGELVTINNPSLAAVEETTATLEASVLNNENVSSIDVGFEYGPAGGPLDQFVSAGSISTPVGFDATVSGLDPGTEYEFRAVGDGDNDSDTTAVRSFSTLSSRPSEPPEDPEDPIAYTVGDVDKNGTIDIVDVVRIQQYLAGLPVSIDVALADVRRTGEVGIVDAVSLQQYLAGLRTGRFVTVTTATYSAGEIVVDLENTGGLGALDEVEVAVTQTTSSLFGDRGVTGSEAVRPTDRVLSLRELVGSANVQTAPYDLSPNGGTETVRVGVSLSPGSYEAAIDTGDELVTIDFTV